MKSGFPRCNRANRAGERHLGSSSLAPMQQMPKNHLLTREEKLQVMRNLLKQAPPEEFNEVFNDLRLLVGDDSLMSQEAACLWALHNKVYFTPVRQKECEVLLTRHNELEESRFLDPQKQVSFKFDHLRKQASDFQAHAQEDKKGEMWRRALYEALNVYVSSHYAEGLCSVFIKDTAVRKILVACIEGHLNRPSAFWNGLWKSEWTVGLTPTSMSAQVTGTIDVHAHYFEDGNIHLTVCKEVIGTLPVTSEAQTAQDFVQLVEKADNQLQAGLAEEYQKMNDSHLKAFRRQLPITHSTIDWEKMVTARIVEAPAVH
ncbi:F-actin-capping protein subunit alpha-1 [Alligator mississippiensis]|uniref:F-actin-capping protein subunit alpha n=1 Tax=Alligator mississippiensis TaxID=8496 RepID=A0A151M9C9_ALLMI|nr:F-actin-capping protein subunit alpha-1 [Alligator mississippiensis]KYO21050.1 F-actin-capping protein subunit alpha-2-like [Alligator mississippiensis]